MRYLRLVVNLWILLPISAELKVIYDKLQQAMGDMQRYAVNISKDAKNQEVTTVVDYKNVSEREKNHINIVSDLAFLLPVPTELQELFESARVLFKDFVKYVEPADDVTGPSPLEIKIRVKYDYHICKHRPPYPRFDVRQSEPCEPEVKYEKVP